MERIRHDAAHVLQPGVRSACRRWLRISLRIVETAVCGFLFRREITSGFDRVAHILNLVAATPEFLLLEAVQCPQRLQLIPRVIKCRDSISHSPVSIQQGAVALDRAEAHDESVDH